jgi:NAD(P)-dependent dehydrogenase (short-subunit alcohol dehydrogenase family)
MTDALLTGKVAVVTGVGPGIGRAAAIALAEAGADIALGARTESNLTQVANEVAATGRHAVWHATNIAEVEDCNELTRKTVEELGRIDILVQNAFMHPNFSTIEQASPEDWRRAFKVNVIGTLQMIQAVLPHMGDGSSIVVTNSMSARNSEPSSGAYAASKSALLSMVRTLAQEVGGRGIRVNSVLPGWVEGQSLDVYFGWMAEERGTTPEQVHKAIAAETALNRIVTPEDVAGAIVFLASDLAHGVTGIQLDVNGGHWLP